MSTTIDLAGKDLKTESVSVADAVELTIDDSVGGGSLAAYADIYSEDPGIRVADSGSLVIDGGTVTARGAGGESAGIGGGDDGSGGTIVINDGDVYVESGGDGAGIGSGFNGDNASVTINGGVVYALGRGDAAGIGSGKSADWPSVTINGGEVRAETTGSAAGIGTGVLGVNPTITITGGTVVAAGNSRGAGIGSGGPSFNGSNNGAGDITISGGTVTATGGSEGGAGIGSGGLGSYASPFGDATITITGGTVRAVGGSAPLGGGAGIGTGLRAGSSDVEIGPDAVVSAKGGTNGSAIGLGAGADPSQYFMTIDGVVTVDVGSAIYVPNDKFLRGTGLVNGEGLIYNDGTILADAGPDWTVERRNYLVTFDANYPSANPASTDVRVLSNQMARGQRAIPAVQRAGWILDGWNTAADGTGSTFTNTTALTAAITVYAQWVLIDHLVIAPASPSLTAGGTQAFTVTAFGPTAADSLGDYTDRVVFESDNSDDWVTDDTILFRKAGDRQVMATLSADSSIRVSTTVTVAPGALSSIALILSATTVEQGGYVTARVVGLDAFGNETGDLTSLAGIESDHLGDMIDGGRVTFPHASPHVITATFDSGQARYTSSVTVEVRAASVGLASTGTDAVPVAGGALLLLLLGGLVLGGALLYRRRRS